MKKFINDAHLIITGQIINHELTSGKKGNKIISCHLKSNYVLKGQKREEYFFSLYNLLPKVLNSNSEYLVFLKKSEQGYYSNKFTSETKLFNLWPLFDDKENMTILDLNDMESYPFSSNFESDCISIKDQCLKNIQIADVNNKT